MTKSFKVEKLRVEIFPDRKSMGQYAASEVAGKLKALLVWKENVRMIFAAAPSQNEFLEELISIEGIDWSRITAFHMDEYIGLPKTAKQLFGNFLEERIFGKVKFKKIYYLNSNPANLDEECSRYSKLLLEAPVDVVCLGIGENGHIAFNDPPVADFNDSKLVKVVELDGISRRQQVNDECFPALNEVPERALTLTIPALLAGHSLFIVVPGSTKAEAVYKTLNGEISAKCPASILRRHNNAVLYLDSNSASRIL